MDLSMLAPDLAKLFGVQPSTLVLLVVIINTVARMVARSIPNDATGFWGFLRQFAAILGTEVASKVTKGVTVADVAAASLKVPPIPQQVARDDEEAKA